MPDGEGKKVVMEEEVDTPSEVGELEKMLEQTCACSDGEEEEQHELKKLQRRAAISQFKWERSLSGEEDDELPRNNREDSEGEEVVEVEEEVGNKMLVGVIPVWPPLWASDCPTDFQTSPFKGILESRDLACCSPPKAMYSPWSPFTDYYFKEKSSDAGLFGMRPAWARLLSF